MSLRSIYTDNIADATADAAAQLYPKPGSHRNKKTDIKKALDWAVAHGECLLAISPPQIDLKNPSKHFYDISLLSDDEEPVRLSLDGSVLPHGFCYLLNDNLSYAEQLVLEVLADVSCGDTDDSGTPMVQYIRGLVNEHREFLGKVAAPVPVGLPTSSKTSFTITQNGREIGLVGYYPQNGYGRQYTAELVTWYAGTRSSRQLMFTGESGESRYWPNLQEASAAVLEAARKQLI